MYKRYDEHDVLKFIKLGRLRWAGHVMRMEESDPALKVLCTKQTGNRDRRGSPKLRWRDMLQEDVSKSWCKNRRINLRESSLKRSNLTQGCTGNGRRLRET
jgi:hypothetical protein